MLLCSLGCSSSLALDSLGCARLERRFHFRFSGAVIILHVYLVCTKHLFFCSFPSCASHHLLHSPAFPVASLSLVLFYTLPSISYTHTPAFSICTSTSHKMFLSKFAGVVALAGAVSASPVVLEKRDGINDGIILNYALTLEHLEDTFYREGLAKYSQQDFAAAGFDSTFYNNIKKVSGDETTHVSFLTTALKGKHSRTQSILSSSVSFSLFSLFL